MDFKDADVEEGKRLRSLGFYREAAVVLSRAAERPATGLEVIFELGETFLFQGYYSRALETLSKALCGVETTGDGFLLATQMLRCCIRAIVTAKVTTSVKEAEQIYSEIWNEESSNHCRILVECYYSEIQQLAVNCRAVSQSEILSQVPGRLESLFEDCISGAKYEDAFRLARNFLTWSSISEPTTLLRELAANSEAPTLIRAKAQAAIGKNLESQSDRNEECDAWNEKATKLFNENGHAHGSLDISTRKACRSAEGEKIITENINKYQQMDYPSGLHSALLLLLDLVVRLHMFEVQASIVADSEKLVSETGASLLGYMTRIQAIAVFGKTLADSGKVITGAVALYDELSNSECLFLQGQAAQLASHACLRLGDISAALHWATKCQSAWKDCTIEDRSTAATLLLTVSLYQAPEPPQLDEIIETATKSIQEDIGNNLAENAIDKINVLVLSLTMKRARYSQLITTLLQEVNEFTERIPAASSNSKLASIYQIQAGHILGDAKSKGDIDGENAALQLLEQAVKLYLKNKQLWEASNARQACGLCYLQMYQKHISDAPLQRAKDLDNALRHFTCAQEAFVAIDATFQIAIANYWIAFCKYEAWIPGWITGKEVLDSIHAAETYIDRQRNEISVLQGLSAITSKQRVSTDRHTRDMYRYALQICIREGDLKSGWHWVQKAKARSLSDLLGLGMLVPKALRTSIAEDPAAQSMFEEEERLLAEIGKAPEIDRFPLRVKVDTHRAKMRDIQALKLLLDMREGVPVGLEALPKIPQPHFSDDTSSDRVIVFADWITNANEILLFTVRDREIPAVHHLPISVSQISSWVEEYYASREAREDSIMEMNDADNHLRTLDPLIAPLSTLSNPGDMIVMCPTGSLHSLPLHALLLPNGNIRTTLLERNPTVYCASLTTFAQCCRSTADAVPKSMTVRDVVAIYEPLPDEEGFDYDERDDVYSSASSLGTKINAKNILRGDQVTPEAFQNIVSTSHMVYFHGHCDLVKNNITEQSLRLSDGHGVAAPYTMKEFFNLRMDGPLFILMACNSATQEVSIGDEPLGLITAILTAGASSVIGTLWGVASETARIFTERFMQKLINVNGSNMIDLAIALQQTVLSLREDYSTRLPYHWAPFILHGSYFSRNIGQGNEV